MPCNNHRQRATDSSGCPSPRCPSACGCRGTLRPALGRGIWLSSWAPGRPPGARTHALLAHGGWAPGLCMRPPPGPAGLCPHGAPQHVGSWQFPLLTRALLPRPSFRLGGKSSETRRWVSLLFLAPECLSALYTGGSASIHFASSCAVYSTAPPNVRPEEQGLQWHLRSRPRQSFQPRQPER